MLLELSIENLGVLPSATAQWAPGLTVLTGETGAGKTFLTSGLKLISGARADSSRVREGSTDAHVEGIFSLANLTAELKQTITETIDDAGAQIENDEVVVSRSISAKGRSRAHIGGRTVPAGVVSAVVEPMLTVHGQHDQLRLLSADQQLDALDSVDPRIAELKATYQQHRAKWRELAKELKTRQENRRSMARQESQLSFALDEIAEIDPQPDEDKNLVDTVKNLQDSAAVVESVRQALSLLDSEAEADGESSALDALGTALSALQSSSDPHLTDIAGRLREAVESITEITADLGRYADTLDADPQELEHALARQAQLSQLTRKYGEDINDVLQWRDQAREQLLGLDTSTEAIERLAKEAEIAGDNTRAAAQKLTEARKAAAAELEQRVTEEIRGLAMPTASLCISLKTSQAYKKQGVDVVEFQLRAHDTAPARPLTSAASGGELSRIMLALEVVLSAERQGTTIVFDEVDAGVGGRAAIEIGRRLMKLADQCQVIVVTHLPQVAAYADHHLRIVKEVTNGADGAATSAVSALGEHERVDELARMMAGLDDTDTGRAHAQELLEKAMKERSQLRTMSS